MDKVIRDHSSDRGLPERASLRGFYLIGLMSSVLGFVLIMVLNLTTPLSFFLNRLAELTLIEIGFRFLIVMVISCSIFFLLMVRLVKPITLYLEALRRGEAPSRDQKERAQRRLLNLPFLFIPVNIGIWLVVPARIQDLTKEMNCRILASRETISGLKDSYRLEGKSPVMVKGYSKPILLYGVFHQPACA